MKWILILILVLLSSLGHKILCVQHIPSPSHYSLMKGIVTALLEGGHEMTLITIFPDKQLRNVRVIDVSFLRSTIDSVNVFDQTDVSVGNMKDFITNITGALLAAPEVHRVLTRERFDAVVTERFFTDVEAGFAAALQTPWILLKGLSMSPHMEHLVDTVRSIPIIPMMMNSAPTPMSIWQRMKNTAWYCLTTLDYLTYYSTEEANYNKFFGPIAEARGVQLPPFSQALHDISVLFLNSHPSFTPAQALPPNVVEIGGYHIDENIPPLPQELQELLDSSKNGVIYFSMGSVVKSKQMPDETKRDLVKMFGELPYTVLWKFEDTMENLPKNLHIRPWMPQTSILAHSNVKVFMTHGGALSTIESLRFGVPILAIPVYGDQPYNAESSVRAGRALMVPFSPDMADDLRVALNRMLNNDSYYERAQYHSGVFNKRPLSPRELIQNYVELAVETKGAYHLRSKTLLYKWYQIWMIDQLAVFLLVLYALYRTAKKIICVIIKKITWKKEKKKNI